MPLRRPAIALFLTLGGVGCPHPPAAGPPPADPPVEPAPPVPAALAEQTVWASIPLSRGPAWTPGTSAELLGSLGTAGQGCASQLLDAQRAAAGANRTLADRASLNCAVAETAGWLRGRLAGLPAHDAAGRSDLVARDLGEALEAAQSIAFQSNLVESLALLGTLDDARSISLSLWGSAPVISPSKLVSQRRLTAHPNRCAGEAPELDKRSAGSPAGSRVLPAWNLTAHDAAVLIAQEMTVQVLKEGVKAAPIWATGCGARLAAPVRLDADGA